MVMGYFVRSLLTAILSLAIFLIMVAYSQPIENRGLGWDYGSILAQLATTGFYTALYFVMCVGILFSAAVEELRPQERRTTGLLRVLYGAITTSNFTRGLLVSPIVFAAFSSQLELATHTFAAILLSFQNGFFWQSIFKGVSRQEDAHAKAAARRRDS
jgi:hypothetical protein